MPIKMHPVAVVELPVALVAEQQAVAALGAEQLAVRAQQVEFQQFHELAVEVGGVAVADTAPEEMEETVEMAEELSAFMQPTPPVALAETKPVDARPAVIAAAEEPDNAPEKMEQTD